MQRKPGRNSRLKQPRPRSRTLKEVHERTLEDLVYPTEITGKRTRQSTDGNKTIKVFLDPKEATAMEYKLDSFSVRQWMLCPRIVANHPFFLGHLQQIDRQDRHLPIRSGSINARKRRQLCRHHEGQHALQGDQAISSACPAKDV